MNSILHHSILLNRVKLPKTLTEIKSRFWHHSLNFAELVKSELMISIHFSIQFVVGYCKGF